MKRSLLKYFILNILDEKPANSVTEIAVELKSHRSAVSRALHHLKNNGYVIVDENQWKITNIGRELIATWHNQVIYILDKALGYSSRQIEYDLHSKRRV